MDTSSARTPVIGSAIEMNDKKRQTIRMCLLLLLLLRFTRANSSMASIGAMPKENGPISEKRYDEF
jgi:hypothetical protein